MEPEKPSDMLFGGAMSRRGVLKTVAGVAAVHSAANLTEAQVSNARGSSLLYAGTYNGAVGNGGNGQGIYLLSMDNGSGELTQVKVVSTVPSPSWLAIHPNGKFLYTVNEISNFNGTTSGSVTSFSINRTTGDLTLLNVVSSQGGGPAFLSVDPIGQFVYVANYGGGSFAVLPIMSTGALGNASYVQQDTGSVGPTTATNAPPGSFAISGHDAPHAHMIQSDLAGKFVFGADLGQDRLYSWMLNRTSGTLIPTSPAFVTVPPGDGPRHFVFHPNGRILYLLTEEASVVVVFSYNTSTGGLTQLQLVSALPKGFTGTSFGSEIRISQDGRYVYAANRLHDSIAIFSVDGLGRLTLIGEALTRGDYPRSFTIDPSGNFLFTCNQRSDAVTGFRINGNGQKLSFTGQYLPLGSPASLVFLT